MRIRRMIPYQKTSRLFNKFSMSVPREAYWEQYWKCTYQSPILWFKGLVTLFFQCLDLEKGAYSRLHGYSNFYPFQWVVNLICNKTINNKMWRCTLHGKFQDCKPVNEKWSILPLCTLVFWCWLFSPTGWVLIQGCAPNQISKVTIWSMGNLY